MKRFGAQKAYLVCMVIMSVFVSILAGCGGGGGGHWNEPDTTRPLVTSSVPAAANPVLVVLSDTDITVTFNENMNPATITAPGAFTVTGPGSTPVPGAAIPVTYDAASRTATFHPAAALTPGTYTATIKGTETNAVKDTAGNALAGNSAFPLDPNDYQWSFTTSLTAPTFRPFVLSTVPVTSTPIPTVLTTTDITARFNKDMSAASITSGTFTVTRLDLTPVAGAAIPVTYVGGTTRTATFHPAAALPAGTYIATIKGTGPSAAKDSFGNALAGKLSSPSVAKDYEWRFTTSGVVTPPAGGPGVLDLMSYGIASAGGITNVGATKINGNVVLDPNKTCNLEPILFEDGPGFGVCGGNPINIPTVNPGDLVITQVYPDTTTADTVIAALNAKWISLSPAILPGATVLGCGTIGNAGDAGALIGCIGNSTLAPGTYISAAGSTIGIAGDLTLNGNATDVWVFQAPTALSAEVSSRIILTGGAKASNVWWYVGSSATIKTNSTFQGNILASAAISMQEGATSCGRLLSGATGAGAFTFLGNTVSVPGHPNAPAGCQ